jgi:hypothetical protein
MKWGKGQQPQDQVQVSIPDSMAFWQTNKQTNPPRSLHKIVMKIKLDNIHEKTLKTMKHCRNI